jgi:hypothetical protein
VEGPAHVISVQEDNVPFYRGTRYPLLAAGGVPRPAVPPEAVSGTEEAAEGDALGTLAPADNAQPRDDAGPAETILEIRERTSSAAHNDFQ